MSSEVVGTVEAKAYKASATSSSSLVRESGGYLNEEQRVSSQFNIMEIIVN